MLQRAAPEAVSSSGGLSASLGVRGLAARWNAQPLSVQFLLAGGAVSLLAMLIVGVVVTKLIEDSVTRYSGAASAIYVDGIIAPLLPDMQRSARLSDSVTQALDETLGQGALGKQILSFRLWARDGTILYSNDKRLEGKRFPPSDDLKAAFAGQMVVEFDQPDDIESVTERNSDLPLLEIYNPVRQPWSGEVVAVSEFYEIATEFEHSLWQARLRSWLAVAGVTSGFFLLLSAIVFRGSRVIGRQSRALQERVGELSELLAQNRLLHQRVQRASQRAAALNESYLRRIGADLHDGPAQLVALAALRLDSVALAEPAIEENARDREITAIRNSLEEAMREIRSICKGLILPHIENADLSEILLLAVKAHEQRTGTGVELATGGSPRPLSHSEKICVYRFVQEALSNAYRHGGGVGQRVRQSVERGRVRVEVADSGPGFDEKAIRPGSLGLAGLRERVESLGGQFHVETSEQGTRVSMILGSDQLEQVR